MYQRNQTWDSLCNRHFKKFQQNADLYINIWIYTELCSLSNCNWPCLKKSKWLGIKLNTLRCLHWTASHCSVHFFPNSLANVRKHRVSATAIWLSSIQQGKKNNRERERRENERRQPLPNSSSCFINSHQCLWQVSWHVYDGIMSAFYDAAVKLMFFFF